MYAYFLTLSGYLVSAAGTEPILMIILIGKRSAESGEILAMSVARVSDFLKIFCCKVTRYIHILKDYSFVYPILTLFVTGS